MLQKICIGFMSCVIVLSNTGCAVLTKAAETIENVLPVEKDESAVAETVENLEIPLSLHFGEKVGLYSGDLLNGLPHGMGKFTVTNPEGDPWFYEGEFREGHFYGMGKITWESGNVQEGEFMNDYIRIQPYQMYQNIASDKDFYFVENANQFLQTNEALFPTYDREALTEFTDEDLTYKIVSKEPNAYGNKLMKLEDLYVGLIEVSYLDESNPNTKYTRLNLIDKDWKCYRMFYLGEMTEVEVDEKLSVVYALPLSTGGFNNASGGYTSTINCALSYYEQ